LKQRVEDRKNRLAQSCKHGTQSAERYRKVKRVLVHSP